MKLVFKGIVAAVLAVAASAGFTAQEAKTLSVTATISGACTLVTSGPMAFGTLNMSSTANEVKQVTATYKCGTGLTVSSFTVGGLATGPYNGIMTGAASAANALPYSITWTPPAPYAGQGFAVAGQQVVLTGTVLNADYITKPADNYAHNVVLAINY